MSTLTNTHLKIRIMVTDMVATAAMVMVDTMAQRDGLRLLFPLVA